MAAEISRMRQEPDYARTISRIISVLRADKTLEGMVNEWREGDLPERHRAVALPAVYAALAPRPQAVRMSIGSADTPSDLPAQQIGTDYHIVALAGGATALEAQTLAYSIHRRILLVIGSNLQLRDGEGGDPLCGTMEMNSVPRMGAQVGTVLEGITLIVRAYNYRVGPTIAPPEPAPDV